MTVKNYNIPFDSFIGGWFIDEKTCNKIIKFYKKTPIKYKVKGNIYVGEKIKVDKKVKDSLDLHIPHNFLESPFDEYRYQLQLCLNEYIKKYEAVDGFPKFNINKDYNLQYYKPGGGYKNWHFERGAELDRVLVFMTFLNDVPDGGTMFKYQNLTVPAKKGLTLIWPTDFTHTHKGQISKKYEKYIVTGWYSVDV